MSDLTLTTDNQILDPENPWMTLVTAPWGEVMSRIELLDHLLQMQDAGLSGIARIALIQEDTIAAVEHHAALVRKDLVDVHRINQTSHMVTWVGVGLVVVGLLAVAASTAHLTFKYARARGVVLPGVRNKDGSHATLEGLQGQLGALDDRVAALDQRVAAGNTLGEESREKLLRGVQAIWGNMRQRGGQSAPPPWATEPSYAPPPVGEMF